MASRAVRADPARSWEIRPARPSDAGELAALGAAAMPVGWSRAAIAGELGRADASTWVLRRPGARAAAGFLTARCVLDEMHVLLVAVVVSERRSGGGAALVAAAVAEARRRGDRAVHLEVRAGNAAARALYRACGFAAVGRRPRYYEGREDAVLMTLALEGAAGGQSG